MPGTRLNRFRGRRLIDPPPLSHPVRPSQRCGRSPVPPYAALRVPGIPQALCRGASHDIFFVCACSKTCRCGDCRRAPNGRTSRPSGGSGAELAGRRRVGAPLPLPGHAPEAVGLRRRDPRAEEAAVSAGRAQPGRGGPVSRRGEGREASRHPDHVLRRPCASPRPSASPCPPSTANGWCCASRRARGRKTAT